MDINAILQSLTGILNLLSPQFVFLWLVFFVWIRSILWVTKDISARSSNIFLQILSILVVAILTPVIWLPLYFIFRPVSYRYQREMQKDSMIFDVIYCKSCWAPNSKDFNHCIFCGESLKTKCKECKNSYSFDWDYCPACWAPNSETLNLK